MPKLKVTAAAVERLKPIGGKQTDYWDTSLPSFGLRVSPGGVKTYQCMSRLNGKLLRVALGRHPTVTLAEARRKAGAVFDAVTQGRDPRVEKEERKAELVRAQGDTYATAVDDFITKHAIAKKNNRRHREQKRLLLRPNKKWHGRPVASITAKEVHEALDGLVAEGKGYTANRVYEALHTFFKWLYQRDRVLADIMAKVERPFGGEEPRTRAWADDELRRIWKAAESLDGHEAVYLRLLLLLGQRRNEIAGIQWTDLNLDAATWKLPAASAKGKRDHTFPLPAPAVQMLTSLPKFRANPFVFAGRGSRTGEPCPMTIGSKLQERIQQASGVADFTFHDARRTFRTGLDRLHIAPHVKDECLNHARRGVGDRHYSQYDFLAEQRSAFDAWANFVGSLAGDAPSNVVTIPENRRAARRASATP